MAPSASRSPRATPQSPRACFGQDRSGRCVPAFGPRSSHPGYGRRAPQARRDPALRGGVPRGGDRAEPALEAAPSGRLRGAERERVMEKRCIGALAALLFLTLAVLGPAAMAAEVIAV